MILGRLKLGGRPRMREKPQGMEVECSFRAGGPRFEEIKKLKTVISKVGDGKLKYLLLFLATKRGCATAKFSSRKGNIRERLAIFGHGSETEIHFWL
jgi:hypothetical protein